ncbi:MAG: hypothetical protein KKF62_10485 [Bacteroidetes bacterium]|nr:hypothetical protein [Bacteroidota bacterium]MBU1114574.1 hypothetical protein [Bacteroidota bacterium]MBU1799053.1 hypothetical protein [Bacteroidota bacterium]
MSESNIPNYTSFTTEFLVDVYSRMDREKDSIKTAAIDKEMRSRFNLSEDESITPETIDKFVNAFKHNNTSIKTKLSKSESMISEGFIAGLSLAGLSLFSWVIGLIKIESFEGIIFDPLGLLDLLFIFALSFGIYKKSRTCAITLTVYYFISRLITIITSFPGGIMDIIWFAVFITFFIRAIIGTIEFNQENDKIKETNKFLESI